MEPLFECAFTPTIRMTANRIRHYSLVQYIVLLVIGIWCCQTALPAAIWYRFDGVWALYALFAVAYLIYGFFMPEIHAYFSVRSFRKDTNGEGVYRIAFGDAIEVRQGNMRIILDYSEITSVSHLRFSYELKRNKKAAVVVDPEGFTKGTFEEFKQFLREKRPDLIIPE